MTEPGSDVEVKATPLQNSWHKSVAMPQGPVQVLSEDRAVHRRGGRGSTDVALPSPQRDFEDPSAPTGLSDSDYSAHHDEPPVRPPSFASPPSSIGFLYSNRFLCISVPMLLLVAFLDAPVCPLLLTAGGVLVLMLNTARLGAPALIVTWGSIISLELRLLRLMVAKLSLPSLLVAPVVCTFLLQCGLVATLVSPHLRHLPLLYPALAERILFASFPYSVCGMMVWGWLYVYDGTAWHMSIITQAVLLCGHFLFSLPVPSSFPPLPSATPFDSAAGNAVAFPLILSSPERLLHTLTPLLIPLLCHFAAHGLSGAFSGAGGGSLAFFFLVSTYCLYFSYTAQRGSLRPLLFVRSRKVQAFLSATLSLLGTTSLAVAGGLLLAGRGSAALDILFRVPSPSFHRSLFLSLAVTTLIAFPWLLRSIPWTSQVESAGVWVASWSVAAVILGILMALPLISFALFVFAAISLSFYIGTRSSPAYLAFALYTVLLSAFQLRLYTNAAAPTIFGGMQLGISFFLSAVTTVSGALGLVYAVVHPPSPAMQSIREYVQTGQSTLYRPPSVVGVADFSRTLREVSASVFLLLLTFGIFVAEARLIQATKLRAASLLTSVLIVIVASGMYQRRLVPAAALCISIAGGLAKVGLCVYTFPTALGVTALMSVVGGVMCSPPSPVRRTPPLLVYSYLTLLLLSLVVLRNPVFLPLAQFIAPSSALSSASTALCIVLWGVLAMPALPHLGTSAGISTASVIAAVCGGGVGLLLVPYISDHTTMWLVVSATIVGVGWGLLVLHLRHTRNPSSHLLLNLLFAVLLGCTAGPAVLRNTVPEMSSLPFPVRLRMYAVTGALLGLGVGLPVLLAACTPLQVRRVMPALMVLLMLLLPTGFMALQREDLIVHLHYRVVTHRSVQFAFLTLYEAVLLLVSTFLKVWHAPASLTTGGAPGETAKRTSSRTQRAHLLAAGVDNRSGKGGRAEWDGSRLDWLVTVGNMLVLLSYVLGCAIHVEYMHGTELCFIVLSPFLLLLRRDRNLPFLRSLNSANRFAPVVAGCSVALGLCGAVQILVAESAFGVTRLHMHHSGDWLLDLYNLALHMVALPIHYKYAGYVWSRDRVHYLLFALCTPLLIFPILFSDIPASRYLAWLALLYTVLYARDHALRKKLGRAVL